MKTTIPVSDKVRQAIEEGRADVTARFEQNQRDRAAIASQIDDLEKIETELVQRSSTLQGQLVRSDEAARQFSDTKLRLEAVRKELVKWRDQLENHRPATLGADGRLAFSAIRYHWEEQIKAIIEERLQEFGVHSIQIVLSQCRAFKVLPYFDVYKFEMAVCGETLQRINRLFDLALEGTVNIYDAPRQTPSP